MSFDPEVEFLNKVLKTRSSAVAKAIPRVSLDWFKAYEAVASYIFDYHEKHGKVPARATVSRSFPGELTKCPTPEPITFYVDQLAERERYSVLRNMVADVTKDLRSNDVNSLSAAIARLHDASEALEGSMGSGAVDFHDFRMEDVYKERESGGDLVTTPYESLNRMVRGFRAPNLVTIAARTGIGKTWLMCLFALCAWKQGHNVLFYSMEMGADEILERMTCILFDLDYIAYIEGRMTKAQEFKLRKKRDALKRRMKNKLVVTDEENMDVSGLQALRAAIQEHDPYVVFVDGSYLMDDAGKGSITEKLTRISRGTKRLARATKTLIFQSVQLNRDAEEEHAHLGNVGWADAYAQDSDFMFFMQGKRTEDHRIIDLVKGRVLASGGMGQFFINFLFGKKLNFSEQTQGANVVHVNTVTG